LHLGLRLLPSGNIFLVLRCAHFGDLLSSLIMNVLVSLQIGCLSETSSTFIANEGFLACVDSQMSHDVRSRREDTMTYTALVLHVYSTGGLV